MTIPLDNDWEFEFPVTRKNTASGKKEAAASLSGLKGWIAASKGGAAINATLEKTLAERSSTAGTYFAIVDGTDIRTHLASYVGRAVYEVFGDGTNVLTHKRRIVVETREPL